MYGPISEQRQQIVRWVKHLISIDRAIILNSVMAAFLCSMAFVTFAKPYEPKKHEVVASWQQFSPDKENQSLVESIEWHLIQGQKPGIQNIHHAKAETLLPRLYDEQGTSADYLYLKARLVQHQHEFDQANDLLDSLLIKSPRHAGAWLLKASILLVQSEHKAASEACKQLFGLTDLLLATSCVLEIQSHDQESLPASYQKMQLVLERFNSQQTKPLLNELQNQLIWMVQLTADMALRSGLPEQALTFLSRFELAEMPLSFIALWADAQIMANNHQQVLTVLSPIVMSQPFKDDALLVRLAIAEKALLNPTNTNQPPLRWKPEITKRVEIRLARNDAFHAADIAKFFIYVDPQPIQALHWAKVNYQQAKMPEDKILLEMAIQLNQITAKGV